MGLAVALVLALDFGVAEFGSAEADKLGFLGGGPVASRRSLLNSNFLFTGAFKNTTGNTSSSGSRRTDFLLLRRALWSLTSTITILSNIIHTGLKQHEVRK